MINLLALDTSGERAILALKTADGCIRGIETIEGRRHGRDLIPRIADLLAEAHLHAASLDVVGVGLGPGSYTGLRVGVMAAKTLAYVTGATVIGVDSLEAVARAGPAEALKISVIGDAQRGDLYVAEFRREQPGGPLVSSGATQIERLDHWVGRLEPGQVVLGPAVVSPRIRAVLPPEFTSRSNPPSGPTAEALIGLVQDAFDAGRQDSLWTLEPNYLRKSAAEEKRLKPADFSAGQQPSPAHHLI